MKIKCSSSCSESIDNPIFTIHAVFDENRELAENMKRVGPTHFTCCYCHSCAKSDSEDEEEQQRRDEKNGLYPGSEDVAN